MENVIYTYQITPNQHTHDGYILSPAARGVAEIFGEPIHVYTRAQAIADGVLVDVSAMAREAGFRVPVAMTSDAWEDCAAWSDEDSARKGTHQDQAGRLLDVLWMAFLSCRRQQGSDTARFYLQRVPRPGRARRPGYAELIARIGGGDDGEPVITIMLAGED